MSIESESAEDAGTASVEELGRRLGEAITDLPEYQSFVEAKEAVEDDERAQEKIREFEQIREEFMLARQTGEATQADLRKLQESQQELHEIPAMSAFLEAQSDLELRLQELNERVSEPLALDFAEKAGGCCQDE
ncbi:regulator [Halobacteriales archaeon QS_1_68_17]|nr:MAG: regulator [Halobacteriales archaeon QS_1_68_17]